MYKVQKDEINAQYLSQNAKIKSKILQLKEVKAEYQASIKFIKKQIRFLELQIEGLKITDQENKNIRDKKIGQIQTEREQLKVEQEKQKPLNLKSNKEKSNYNSSNNIFNILKRFTKIMVSVDRFSQSVTNHRRTKYW